VSKEGGGIVVVVVVFVVVGADIVVGVVGMVVDALFVCGLWPSSMPLTEYMQCDSFQTGKTVQTSECINPGRLGRFVPTSHSDVCYIPVSQWIGIYRDNRC
jgi:hypothetical protein